uniref:Uncharacterized protein n=1 Tax=Cacopsylla melanoneura TaxID=428564 RepID=A0A8D8RE37_9HEMI
MGNSTILGVLQLMLLDLYTSVTRKTIVYRYSNPTERSWVNSEAWVTRQGNWNTRITLPCPTPTVSSYPIQITTAYKSLTSMDALSPPSAVKAAKKASSNFQGVWLWMTKASSQWVILATTVSKYSHPMGSSYEPLVAGDQVMPSSKALKELQL